MIWLVIGITVVVAIALVIVVNYLTKRVADATLGKMDTPIPAYPHSEWPRYAGQTDAPIYTGSPRPLKNVTVGVKVVPKVDNSSLDDSSSDDALSLAAIEAAADIFGPSTDFASTSDSSPSFDPGGGDFGGAGATDSY